MRVIIAENWPLALLVLLLVANSMTYLLVRHYGNKGAELIKLCEVDDNQPTTYIIAGNLAQPDNTGEFLLDELEGDIVFCRYRQLGWNPLQMADDVLEDIEIRNNSAARKVRVVAISCGDMVARCLEYAKPEAPFEVSAINPAADQSLLRTPMSLGLGLVAQLLSVAALLLGCLSFIPVIPASGSRYSLALLADQWWQLALGEVPHCVRNTTGIILSSHDVFLNNAEVREYFEGVPTVTVEAGHADTIGSADKFLTAYRDLVSRTPSS